MNAILLFLYSVSITWINFDITTLVYVVWALKGGPFAEAKKISDGTVWQK